MTQGTDIQQKLVVCVSANNSPISPKTVYDDIRSHRSKLHGQWRPAHFTNVNRSFNILFQEEQFGHGLFAGVRDSLCLISI